MNVIMLPGSVSRLSGGLFTSVRRLSESLNSIDGMNVTVMGHYDEYSNKDIAAWKRVPILVNSKNLIRRVGFIGKQISLAAPDLLHPQFLWSYASIATMRWHRTRPNQRKYLVSPRGMLDKWALRNSRWKKRLAASLFERRHLQSASCIHALCESEALAIREFGLENPIAVIPNGIDLPSFDEINFARSGSSDRTDERKCMLFMGRIHPKKGLVELVEAWRLACRKLEDWRLVIAGWDDGGHLSSLKQRVSEYGLNRSVSFAGAMYGDAKNHALANADAFILPSFSEGLPISILEAWAYELPVLATKECNLPIGPISGASIEITNSPEDLAASLVDFVMLSSARRSDIGRTGRDLVSRHFQWNHVARQMMETYDWVLGGENFSPPLFD